MNVCICCYIDCMCNAIEPAQCCAYASSSTAYRRTCVCKCSNQADASRFVVVTITRAAYEWSWPTHCSRSHDCQTNDCALVSLLAHTHTFVHTWLILATITSWATAADTIQHCAQTVLSGYSTHLQTASACAVGQQFFCVRTSELWHCDRIHCSNAHHYTFTKRRC
jgi:hypothetical protein